MIYLAANHASVPRWRSTGLPVGWMMSPKGWRPPRVPFALDNGLFYDRATQRPKGMAYLPPFYAMVARTVEDGHSPMFVAVPDVPYNMKRSRDLSAKHRRHLKARYPDIPLAVVLQDGANDDDLDGYEWAFLGGSNEFKWGRLGYWADACRERGMPLHVGRVNSGDRITACFDAGAASADGTSWGRGDRRQLRGIVAALRHIAQRMEGVPNPRGAQCRLFPGGPQVPEIARAHVPN